MIEAPPVPCRAGPLSARGAPGSLRRCSGSVRLAKDFERWESMNGTSERWFGQSGRPVVGEGSGLNLAQGGGLAGVGQGHGGVETG